MPSRCYLSRLTVAWLFAILGAVGFGGFLLFMIASDPRGFFTLLSSPNPELPKDYGWSWFFAVSGQQFWSRLMYFSARS
jgi:hypothetical protein